MVKQKLERAGQLWAAFNVIPMDDPQALVTEAIELHKFINEEAEVFLSYSITEVYDAYMNLATIILALGTDQPEYIEMTKDE